VVHYPIDFPPRTTVSLVKEFLRLKSRSDDLHTPLYAILAFYRTWSHDGTWSEGIRVETRIKLKHTSFIRHRRLVSLTVWCYCKSLREYTCVRVLEAGHGDHHRWTWMYPAMNASRVIENQYQARKGLAMPYKSHPQRVVCRSVDVSDHSRWWIWTARASMDEAYGHANESHHLIAGVHGNTSVYLIASHDSFPGFQVKMNLLGSVLFCSSLQCLS